MFGDTSVEDSYDAVLEPRIGERVLTKYILYDAVVVSGTLQAYGRRIKREAVVPALGISRNERKAFVQTFYVKICVRVSHHVSALSPKHRGLTPLELEATAAKNVTPACTV
jgi:hypothetical protein